MHYPSIAQDLVAEALDVFFDLREIPGLKKKPSTSELIDWLKLLLSDRIPAEVLHNPDASVITSYSIHYTKLYDR